MKTACPPTAPTLRTRSLILWAAFVLTGLNAAAAIPVPEKLLPDDTLAVMTVPDFAKLRDLYRASPQSQCWDDPALKPFKDKFVAKFKEEFVQPLERDLGVSLDQYANLPQGQVTIAVTQNATPGKSDAPPGVILLLDARDRSTQLKTNLALLRRKWVDAGKTIRTEKIRDIEFSVLPLTSKDLPGSLKKIFPSGNDEESGDTTNKPPKAELVFGQFESLLIVGNSTKAVEKVAAHLTGGSAPALGDVPSYQANHMAMFRDAPVYGWANLKTFVDLFNRRMSEKDSADASPFGMPRPDKIMAALGIGGLKTLAFNVQNSSEGSSAQVFLGVPESGRQGLFNLLPNTSKESGPPTFVPADVIKFQRWRVDGQKAWTTLEKIINDVQPGGVNMLIEAANAAGKEKDPNFDLKKDLIGNLGDDIMTYQKAPRGATLADLAAPPALFLLGSSHPEQFVAALKIIATLVNPRGGPPAEREFLGRKIYSITPPGAGARGDSGKAKLNFSASGGYIAMGMDATMVEEYLRSSDSPQKALRETAGLSEAITRAGGSSTGVFGYENQAETMRSTIEVLKKTFASGDSPAMLAPGIPAFTPENPLKDWLDFSLLPPFEKIAKYFYFTVYTGGANAEGLTLKMYSPVPPQLRK